MVTKLYQRSATDVRVCNFVINSVSGSDFFSLHSWLCNGMAWFCLAWLRGVYVYVWYVCVYIYIYTYVYDISCRHGIVVRQFIRAQ